MHIDHFEEGIEEKILRRGEAYFEDGAVDELWQEPGGVYCAVVDGAEPYEVGIFIDENGEILEHFCDCPYEWGEFCKHEVATLLAIRQVRAYGLKLPAQRQKKQRGLKAFLSKYRKAQLIDLICMLSREYSAQEEIRQYLMKDEWGNVE